MTVTLADRGARNTVELPENPAGKITVEIDGDDNAVILHNARRVSNLAITVTGHGGRVEIDPLRIGALRVAVKNGGQVVIGKRTSIEDAYILCDQGCRVSLGEDCMLSFNVQIRTTDAHGIYSVATGERLNPVGDIAISDHVWISQGVVVSKGTVVGRNSVIGANAFVQNSVFPPSCMLAGSPARLLNTGIIWDRRNAERMCFDDDSMDPLFPRWWEIAQSDRD